MGDPLSPLLALIFVSYDEHQHRLHIYSLQSHICHVFQKRYMDDAIAIILTNSADPSSATRFAHFMQNDFYEHDLTQKNLLLTPSKDDDKYLEADVIISDDKRSIKLIYHNKNASIIETHEQDHIM